MKPSETSDDYALIRRIAAGDEAAFEMLFGRLAPDVFKLSYAMLLDRQAAEDAVQESFIKLWNHAGSWRPEASVKTWLMTIVRNVCLDILRKKRSESKKTAGII
ncbi:MAG: sigma-70 family RNA polymerase sigma factor [Alphaproteobacteria bacterium]|nr:sigma-70 family RNA polymerase sigma factor [Alphaproteobacteria bacterium]